MKFGGGGKIGIGKRGRAKIPSPQPPSFLPARAFSFCRAKRGNQSEFRSKKVRASFSNCDHLKIDNPFSDIIKAMPWIKNLLCPKHRKHQLYFLIIYLVLANLLVLVTRPSYLGNLLIVYAVPTAVTFYWLKNGMKFKIALFAGITALLFAPPIELMARLANSWDVQTAFPRIYGIAPIENLIYAFVNFLFPISSHCRELRPLGRS